MRKELPVNEYTQLNTNETDFLIQNISNHDLLIIISDTQPANSDPYDFIVTSKNGIGNLHFTGICYGKPSGSVPITVGIVEG
jgi:hypothetical protein